MRTINVYNVLPLPPLSLSISCNCKYNNYILITGIEI